MNATRTLVAVAVALACGVAAAAPADDTSRSTAGMAVDPVLHRAFLTERDTATLGIVDLDSGIVVAHARAGAPPLDLAANAADGLVYVLGDGQPGAVTVIDGASARTLTTIGVGNAPRALAADFAHGRLYVVNRDDATVSMLDTRVNAVVGTVPIGASPTGLALAEDGTKLYVANADGTLAVVDTARAIVTSTIGVGGAAASVAIDTRTHAAYVNDPADATLAVIDTRSDEVLAQLAVGHGSARGTVSAVLGRYYLPDPLDGTVTIVDTTAQRVVRTLAVGESADAVLVDAAASIAYVGDGDRGRVAMIDARSDAFLAPLPVPAARMALDPAHTALLTVSERDRADTMTAAPFPAVTPDSAIATEYRDAAAQRYFHTAGAAEDAFLRDGALDGAWKRTEQYWRVWTTPAPGRVPMCRFYGAGFGGEHVYTPYMRECGGAKSMPAGWRFEGVAYFVQLPARDGSCAGDTVPLYRLYDGSANGTPAHRYTPDRATRDAMVAQGWVAEGNGDDAVFACTPPLMPASAAAPTPSPDQDHGVTPPRWGIIAPVPRGF